MLPTQEILILRDPISKQNLFPPDIDLHRLKLYPEDRLDNCSMPITLETPPTRVSLDFEPRSRPCKNRRSGAPTVSKKGKTNRQLKARVTRPQALKPTTFVGLIAALKRCSSTLGGFGH